MPLYLVRRGVPGATPEEMDAAGYRAIACSYYYPGLRWIRSFWDVEHGVLDCVYEARSADDIIDHSRASLIPCDEVREVQAFGPENYTGQDAQELAKT